MCHQVWEQCKLCYIERYSHIHYCIPHLQEGKNCFAESYPGPIPSKSEWIDTCFDCEQKAQEANTRPSSHGSNQQNVSRFAKHYTNPWPWAGSDTATSSRQPPEQRTTSAAASTAVSASASRQTPYPAAQPVPPGRNLGGFPWPSQVSEATRGFSPNEWKRSTREESRVQEPSLDVWKRAGESEVGFGHNRNYDVPRKYKQIFPKPEE